MSEFDSKARDWDLDQKHIDRSIAIAAAMEKSLDSRPGMKALEYGAGTGLLSFQLRDRFAEIVLMDNSSEMIRVCKEKVKWFKTPHIKPLLFDLEHHDFDGTFDIVYSQMVMHHVKNPNLLLQKFHNLLIKGGQLVVADLYEEDGSFHGPDSDAHKGFNPDALAAKLNESGFTNSQYSTCFHVKRPNGIEYPVFLMVSQKRT